MSLISRLIAYTYLVSRDFLSIIQTFHPFFLLYLRLSHYILLNLVTLQEYNPKEFPSFGKVKVHQIELRLIFTLQSEAILVQLSINLLNIDLYDSNSFYCCICFGTMVSQPVA